MHTPDHRDAATPVEVPAQAIRQLPAIPTLAGQPALTDEPLARDTRVTLHLASVALARFGAEEALAYFDAVGLCPPIEWLLGFARWNRDAIDRAALFRRAADLAGGDMAHVVRIARLAAEEGEPDAAIEIALRADDQAAALRVVADVAIRQELSTALLAKVRIPPEPELRAAVDAITEEARARLHALLLAQPRVTPETRARAHEADTAEMRRRHVARIAAELHDIEGDDLVARALDEPPPPAGPDDYYAEHGPAMLAEGRFAIGRYESALRTLVHAGLVPPLLSTGERAFVDRNRVWARRFFLAAEAVREQIASEGSDRA
jgi:hypothetical protein